MENTTYFVQRGRSVVSGTRHAGDHRVYSQGEQIALPEDEAARLIALGVIGSKPPVLLQTAAPGSNPAGIGLQPGADAGRRY